MKGLENGSGGLTFTDLRPLLRSLASGSFLAALASSDPMATSRHLSGGGGHAERLGGLVEAGDEVAVRCRLPWAVLSKDGLRHQDGRGEVVGELLDADLAEL